MKSSVHSHSNLPKPTEVELEILTSLWSKGEATVRELHEDVSRRRALGYTSVLKTLQIMTEKGLVERDERERAHVYRAAVSQADTEHRFLRELSERFFAGSAAQLALRALEMESASEEELAAIRKLIARKSAAQ